MRNCKTISTTRLLLVPFSEKYLSECYVSWLNDPEIVKFSELRHHTHTLESCKKYVDSYSGSANLLFAIVVKDNEKHIGNINAYLDLSNLTADVGILIGEKKNWGQGIALEVLNAMVQLLFESYNVRKVTAGSMAVNYGMLRVMERAGMQVESIMKRQFLLDGVEVDMIQTAIFNKAKQSE